MISELLASSKFLDSFGELGYDKDFEGENFKCHKVILSPSLVRSFSHSHPLIYMRGVKDSDCHGGFHLLGGDKFLPGQAWNIPGSG